MSKKDAARQEDIEALDAKIVELLDMRQTAKGLGEDIKAAQEEILADLDRLGLDQHVVKDGRKQVAKATRVQNSSEVLNEPMLRKRLGATVWAKVTTRTLDKTKLAQAIKDGTVKANDVAACSDTKTSAPFVKIT